MDIKKNNFSSISFVVPCYNEEDNISDVINEIESAIMSFSNIFCHFLIFVVFYLPARVQMPLAQVGVERVIVAE